MAKIDELIKHLPKEIQEMARAHISIVIDMKAAELEQWLGQIAGKHYQGAYESLNARLAPAERIVEQDRLNSMIQLYNRENKTQIDMWRNFFITLISILIQSAKNEIME